MESYVVEIEDLPPSRPPSNSLRSKEFLSEYLSVPDWKKGFGTEAVSIEMPGWEEPNVVLMALTRDLMALFSKKNSCDVFKLGNMSLEIPDKKWAWSNLLTHFVRSSGIPALSLVPKYSVGMKLARFESQLPVSNGVNSY
jgi:hypothetical protein